MRISISFVFRFGKSLFFFILSIAFYFIFATAARYALLYILIYPLLRRGPPETVLYRPLYFPARTPCTDRAHFIFRNAFLARLYRFRRRRGVSIENFIFLSLFR